MNLSDIGAWCVVWLTSVNGKQRVAHAFFSTREEANIQVTRVGGELYLKHSDGSLKRNG